MRKNVLILAASMRKGGAERVISLLLKQFESDVRVNLHFVMMEDGVAYEIPSNIKITVLSESKKHGVRKFLELPYVSWQVFKYIKNNNIDMVMSFLYRPNYVNVLAKLFGSKHKAIINIRSVTSRYLKEGLTGKANLFLIKKLFNKADLIVSNSTGVDEDLKSLMKISTDTNIIYNPLDLKYIESKKYICEDVEFDFKNDIKYIISVGRLIPLKRNKDLINAFYELQKNDEKLETIFIGDGILRDKLIDFCIDLNIKEKVHFLGNVNNPFYYLNKSDLFVMNSEVEGFPNVLVEAMACGLPVISSDCKSGPREILEDEKYGLLYPVGKVEVLIGKMKYYLYNDIEKNSIKRLEDFNLDKIMQQFKNVL
jgi:N-acetylgalactosamine-N,N'-diacetylbacillosaminyl-diphospho-undecaprenol 4-alpha-N-acetylgalactosaminyltransferase